VTTHENAAVLNSSNNTTYYNFAPGSLSGCTGDTRAVIEGTLGFWYRIYDGPKGSFPYGTQYSYVTRNTWPGSGTGSLPGDQRRALAQRY